jgi:hypothetical protein
MAAPSISRRRAGEDPDRPAQGDVRILGAQAQPLGYKIKFQIVDWPDGMPGDVGITLKWS